MTQQSAACPLCDAIAPFEARNFARAKLYACASCGDFVISNLAERRVAESPASWRTAMSAQAKVAREGFILLIRRPQITTQGAPQNVALEGRYVLRSDWSR